MYSFFVESGEATHFEPRGCIIEKKLFAYDKTCVYVSVHPPIDDEYYISKSADRYLVLIPGPKPIWPKSKAIELDFFNIQESQFPVAIQIGTINTHDISESGRIDDSRIRVIDKGSLIKSPDDRWKY